MSRCPDKPVSAGLTADSIERYYDMLDRKRKEHHDARSPGEDSVKGNSGTGEDEEVRKENLDDDDSKASEIVDSTEVDSSNAVTAKMNLDAALQALQIHDKDAFNSAITSLTKLGLRLNQLAKVAADASLGSLAAEIQAGIGNVAAGSEFAVLTSAGMGGAGLTAVMGVSACIPVAVAIEAALWTRWQKKKNDDANKMDWYLLP